MQEVFEKIVERLENESHWTESTFDEDGYCNDDSEEVVYLDRAIEIVKQTAEDYNDGWIPFTQRKLSEEEKKEIGTEYDYMLDCKLPEEDEEILVTYANRTVGEDIFMCDGTDCYLDSGNDFITEAVAWRHKPDPYRPNGE